MKVAIIGGTGFVGTYLVTSLIEARHDVTLLVRPGSESKLEQPGSCRTVPGEVSDPDALRATLDSADAVVYNIGILREFPRKGITFEETQYRGVERVVAVAKQMGVKRFLLMSSNGVKRPGTPYQETKYRAEECVQADGFDYTIFRPSVIFGDPKGKLEIATQLYRDMVRPPIPAVGFHTGWRPSTGQVLMSPVHVQDVADAFVSALGDAGSIGKTFILGGPEVLSWADMLHRVSEAVGRKKIILPMPIGIMMLGATLFDWLPFFPVTRDQLRMLAEGNEAAPDDLRSLIGRDPVSFSTDSLSYLGNTP